jgi:hypothetical protein
MTIFDYDFITEHEFFRHVDPSRCGKDMEHLIADSFAIRAKAADDWFTGGKMTNSMKPPKEDFFL